MSNEFKTSNRGGVRPGAGRPSSFGKATNPSDKIADTKISINVIKELEKVFKELKKGSIDEGQLNVAKLKVDVLNKLLPYVEHKKPVASLNTADEGKIPTHTVLNVVTKDNTTSEVHKDKDEGDFV